jgi:cytochrome c oxidase subunit III
LEAPLDLRKRLLALNTAILLASSLTLEAARAKLRVGQREKFSRLWQATTALGLLFLAGQFLAWRILAGKGVYLNSNPEASFFYLFTAAHAIHLIGGITGLLAVAFKSLRHLTLATATRVAAIYWHFLTAIWLAIFMLLTLAAH